MSHGSTSDYDPSGEEPGTAGGPADGSGGGSDSDEGTSGEGSDGGDALGVFDDVDDDVYAARLERWLKAWPRQIPCCRICYYVIFDNAALFFATTKARAGDLCRGRLTGLRLLRRQRQACFYIEGTKDCPTSATRS